MHAQRIKKEWNPHLENTQFCEHAVKQKLEGKWIAKRIGLIVLYGFILLVAAFLGLLYKNILPFLVVAALIEVGLIPLTWRRTKLEYEYTMTGGILTFSYIYGGSSQKLIFEVEQKMYTMFGLPAFSHSSKIFKILSCLSSYK